jgi:ABC-type amino acid transport system permease subunit
MVAGAGTVRSGLHAEPDRPGDRAIAIIVAVHLCFSLSISAFMNWYNARIAFRTR